MIRALLLLLAIGLTTVGLVVPSSPTGGISLSNDGTQWGGSLSRPLFDESIRWVPGDVRNSQFFIRSEATTNTNMSVNLISPSGQRLLEAGQLAVQARVADGPWQSTDPAGTTLLATAQTSPRDTTRVEVQVSFLGEARDRANLEELELQFQINLTPVPGNSFTNLVGTLPGSVKDIFLGLFLLSCVLLSYLWGNSRRNPTEAVEAVTSAS